MNKFRIAATLVFVTSLIAAAHAENKTPFNDIKFFGGSISVTDKPNEAGFFTLTARRFFSIGPAKEKKRFGLGMPQPNRLKTKWHR
jgi:hypothetical protein